MVQSSICSSLRYDQYDLRVLSGRQGGGGRGREEGGGEGEGGGRVTVVVHWQES